MNLRNRSLLILGSIFFVLFIFIAGASLWVTLSGLERLEHQDMQAAVTQTTSALNAENQALLGTTEDWAWWDDMAAFAQDRNPEFIDRNARPEHFATVGVHLFLILDDKGTVLQSVLLSPDLSQETPLPSDMLRAILETPELVTHSADDSGRSGLVKIPEEPMILASAPILDSERNGPVRGTVIMGRYLDYGPRQRITSVTGYDFTVHWHDDYTLDEEPHKTLERQLDEKPLVVAASNESLMAGVRVIDDFSGNDAFLTVTKSRDLYRAGLANISTYLILLALWAAMTAVLVVLVIDRSVLLRVDQLTRRVRALSKDPDASPAMVLTGNDELALLEKTILTMREDSVTRERQIRAFINAMPDPAALFTLDGKVVLTNTAFAVYAQAKAEDLTGTDIQAFFPKEEIARHRKYVDEAVRTKAMVRFEQESGGTTLLVSYYPVLDAAGTVVQIGLLTFDISERKRLENALQKVTRKISLLNTVIFSDIQNKVFVQRGYQELLRKLTDDRRVLDYLEKEESAVLQIQGSLRFAKQFNDMGANPPRWQNTQQVLLFAISHLDPGMLRRDFRLEGLEIYADPLLERVFFSLVENTVLHGRGASLLRAEYSVTGAGLLIVFEDDGCGIPAENKERIFNKGAGTSGAVGLFLAREILSITGITIRETGEAGKGARFEILVPTGSYRVFGKQPEGTA